MSERSSYFLVAPCLAAVLAAGVVCGPGAEQGLSDRETDPGERHGDGDLAELSDLDRSAEELFAERCGHDELAHQCDGCRYEVGVVRVPEELIEQGLVRVAAAGSRSFGRELELTGEISFDERTIAHLGPRLPGIIRRVFVDLGQVTAEGEPLIEIDSAELAQAQAAYLEALATHRLARRSHDRQNELREAKITSEREYLEAKQESEAAAIRANSERQKLLRLGIVKREIAELEKSGIAGATGRYLLKAPFAGEVLEMHAVQGERVELDRDLILFGDTRALWVWVDLYESHLGAIARAPSEEGLPASVSVRAYPAETFEGHVDFVGRTMDEETRTVKARITLENPGGKLRPGMFATVRLAVGGNGQGLAVPESAILSDEERDFVFVRHHDDYFLRRPVARGRHGDGFVEILDGLAPGQTIAVAGAFLLKSDVLRSKMGEGCAH